MKRLTIAGVSAVIGAIGCGWVLSDADHMGRLGPNAAAILFGRMVISLLFCGVGFVLFLGWRDRRRQAVQSFRPAERGAPAVPPRGIYALEPGARYRVLKSFVDYHGNGFEGGEVLVFQRRSFVPYHGGHTLFFESRAIYLQETENAEILERFEEYLTRAAPSMETRDERESPWEAENR